MKRYLFFLTSILYFLTTNSQQHIKDVHDHLARFQRAQTFFQLNKFEEALTQYLFLLKHVPTANTIYNTGYVLKAMGRMQDAIPFYEHAKKLSPDDAKIHWGLAQAYLATGDFKRGWNEYLWRFSITGVKRFSYHKNTHVITPEEFKNKRVLLHREGEIGDNIFFIRYAKLLKECGATVIAQIHPALEKLFSLCDYIDEITTESDALFESYTADFLLWQQNMPLIFQTTVETVPAPVPYLHADKKLSTFWKEKLKHDTNFKIGICWNANPNIYLEQNPRCKRSVPLELFAPLAQLPGISMYSLQKINGTEQLNKLPPNMCIGTFENLDEAAGSFMDTAAIMQHLDLIISVDTSIAHLAGALGRPVWVLLPEVAEWRWMLNRTDSPWYPTMRLFRQQKYGDWQPVIQEVIRELKNIKKDQQCQA